jgi:hypothetical protein
MNPSTIRTRVEIDYAAPKSLVDYKDIYKTLYNINAYYPTVYTQHRYKIYITNLIVDLLTNEYGYVGLSRI